MIGSGAYSVHGPGRHVTIVGFFLTREGPRRVQTALIGGITSYMKDLKISRKYNQVPGFYKRTLAKNLGTQLDPSPPMKKSSSTQRPSAPSPRTTPLGDSAT